MEFLTGKIQELEAVAKKLTQKASLNTNPLEITLTEVKNTFISIDKFIYLFLFLVNQQVVSHRAAARTRADYFHAAEGNFEQICAGAREIAPDGVRSERETRKSRSKIGRFVLERRPFQAGE